MIVCDNCGRPEAEHARQALSSDNSHGWKWEENACPVGSAPFHPRQTYTAEGYINTEDAE
jgi:hypothetical protein